MGGWASGAWGSAWGSAWGEGVAVEEAVTGLYAAEHAAAYRAVAAAGPSVTFSTGTPGTYDAATGVFTSPTTGTVTGVAVRKQPSTADLERFRARGMTEDKTVLLLFVPTTYGDTPTLGASVTWEGETMLVRDRKPLAPDGVVIKSDIACSR